MKMYLVDGDSIPLSPDLAAELGVNHAIVLQQLHFLLTITQKSKTNYNRVDGHWWVYNSYPQWRRDYFKWLSESAIKSIFRDLEERKLIITRQGVKSAFDRKKWYRIDYTQLEMLIASMGQKMSHDIGQKMSDENGQKMSDVYTETTPETTSDTAADEKKQLKRSINGVIGAYLEANRSLANGDYGNRTMKKHAEDLLKAGVTSKQVFDYIVELKRQPFWSDKSVSLHYVLTNITAWLEKQPAERPAKDAAPAAPALNMLDFTGGA